MIFGTQPQFKFKTMTSFLAKFYFCLRKKMNPKQRANQGRKKIHVQNMGRVGSRDKNMFFVKVKIVSNGKEMEKNLRVPSSRKVIPSVPRLVTESCIETSAICLLSCFMGLVPSTKAMKVMNLNKVFAFPWNVSTVDLFTRRNPEV